VPAQVNDGVEVVKAVSYTPVTFKILSLPPGLRGALGTIVMIALLPPKIKNYNAMFRPIVDMLVALAPEGAGISVGTRTVSLVVAWLLNVCTRLPDRGNVLLRLWDRASNASCKASDTSPRRASRVLSASCQMETLCVPHMQKSSQRTGHFRCWRTCPGVPNARTPPSLRPDEG